MKKTALVIMAAGIGSRFGKGIKQLEPVGPNGEIIMDYSIHDALEAGFDKVVFIIRKDLEEDFRRIIGNRIEKLTQVQYAFQALEDLPEGFVKPKGRTKPWGTGQAVLCCKDLLEEPFVVINADDYYGKEPYVRLHEYLVQETGEREDQIPVCMAGFTLGNTLSDNGGVTRGICQMDGSGRLTGIRETKNIVKTLDGAAVEGPGGLTPVDVNSKVSAGISAGAGDGICQVFEESDAGRGTKSGVPSPHHHRRADPGGPCPGEGDRYRRPLVRRHLSGG